VVGAGGGLHVSEPSRLSGGIQYVVIDNNAVIGYIPPDE
jgi:hypothetical protein